MVSCLCLCLSLSLSLSLGTHPSWRFSLSLLSKSCVRLYAPRLRALLCRQSCSPDGFGEDPFTGYVAHLGVWSTVFTDDLIIAEAINPLQLVQPKSSVIDFLRLHLADFDPEVGTLQHWQDLSKYGHHVSFTEGKVAPLIACPANAPKFTPGACRVL